MEQLFAVRGQSHKPEECAAATPEDAVTLVPDPDNEFHDPSRSNGYPAIKVLANDAHIGFVPIELVEWFATHEVKDLRLHRSKSSGMLIVYFTSEDLCPKQGSVARG